MVSAQIAPGIHRIELPLGTRLNCVYLIEGEKSVLLFDTGIAGQLQDYLLPYMEEIGRSPEEISQVVISHCDIDHWGGSADARAIATQAILTCHRDDRDLIENTELTIAKRYQEFLDDHGIGWSEEFRDVLRMRARPDTIDVSLLGGERIDLGNRVVEVVHVPGHSSGHLAVWDFSTRALIIADAALGNSVYDLAGEPAMPPNYRHPTDYRRTCALLFSYRPEWLLTSHFPVMGREGAADFLRLSLDYCDFVEQSLLIALDGRSRSTLELIEELQPSLGPWEAGTTDFGVASMLVGHLEELLEQGVVKTGRLSDTHRVFWSIA